MNSNERFEILLEKYLEQSLTPDEREEFRAQVERDADSCARYVAALEQASLLRRRYHNEAFEATRANLLAIRSTQSEQKTPDSRVVNRKQSRAAWAIAAVAALILCTITLRLSWQAKDREVAVIPSPDLSDVVVGPNQELSLKAEEYVGRKVLTQDRALARVRFKDSTTIELKENTHIRIDSAGERTGKQVETLQGLVEVNASPQPKDQPLKLQSAHGTVTVLGTVFWMNVDKKGTSVDLLDGNVVLTRTQDNATLQLKAGQRSVISSDSTLTTAPLKLMDGKLLYREEFDTGMKNWRSAGGQLIVLKKSPDNDQFSAKMLPAKESQQTSATLDFQNVFARTPDFFVVKFTMKIGTSPGEPVAIHFAPVSDVQGTEEDAFDPSSEKPRRSSFGDRWGTCKLEISQTRGVNGQPILSYRSYINDNLFEAKRMPGSATGFRITHNNTFSIADFFVFERSPSGL